MSDAWAELQALKSKRDFRRKRLQERKKERQDILNLSGNLGVTTGEITITQSVATGSSLSEVDPTLKSDGENLADGSFEDCFLQCFCDAAIHLPVDSRQLLATVNKSLGSCVSHDRIVNLLEKFAVQQLISVEEKVSDDGDWLEVISADHTKLAAMATPVSTNKKRRAEEIAEEDNGDAMGSLGTEDKKPKENDVLSLLSLASTREKEDKRIGEEILELLSRPSIKEKTLAEKFRSQGGTTVREFCPQGTKSECRRTSTNTKPCTKLHFRKIIQGHTDESLGDCSFLNTCFHMESCKYVHYEVDNDVKPGTSPINISPLNHSRTPQVNSGPVSEAMESKAVLHPPQWVHCDLRFFDMTTLGKFSVIMADPPWDIHMNLPYGTMSDDEMRQLNIPALQDEGLIFLWVTGRAMELGRECLQLWGYERVDELIWVKTNQLQRIIRTGRTGHWLNHGKEHCLVGMKGNPPVNRGLDCDVIVAEVRATSHKPDEVYGIIERLSPGTRKIELFGRPHNIQPNWMTLGNQLDGAHLVDEELRSRFYNRYPDGDCMAKPK